MASKTESLKVKLESWRKRHGFTSSSNVFWEEHRIALAFLESIPREDDIELESLMKSFESFITNSNIPRDAYYRLAFLVLKDELR